MSDFLTTGCLLTCSMGTAPGVFTPAALPGKPTVENTLIIATIADIIPLENVPSFAMCRSPTNPEVASATTAAGGVLTPMPCVPNVVLPWEPASTTSFFEGMPLVTIDGKCLCAWSGEIAVDMAAQEIASAE